MNPFDGSEEILPTPYIYGAQINARVVWLAEYIEGKPKEKTEYEQWEMRELSSLFMKLQDTHRNGYDFFRARLVSAAQLPYYVEHKERLWLPIGNSEGVASAFIDWGKVVEYYKEQWAHFEYFGEDYYLSEFAESSEPWQ